MNYILLVIASVLLITGIVVGRGQQVQVNTDVIEITDETIEENSKSESKNFDKEIIDIVIIPTTQVSIVIVTPTIQLKTNRINDWIYPGSVVVSSKDNGADLRSTDNDVKITAWYKEKIISFGMNFNSFVTTTTNGNVLNKLVGSDANFEVKVDINKAENEENVGIIIELIEN